MTTLALSSPSQPLSRAMPDWLDTQEYPWIPKEFATPDGVVRYVDVGSGPTIVFVHGTPSWSWEWRHLVRAFQSTHRCIAMDHLGFGLSDKPLAAPLKPADHTQRLSALLQSLDVRDVTLVVHDFGGPIGLGWAVHNIDRVAGIAILNTWMWPLGDQPKYHKMSRLVRSWFGRFLYRWLNISPRVLVPSSFGDRRALTPGVHKHYLAPFASRAERTAPWVLGCELTGSDAHYQTLWNMRDVLSTVPIALVWGDKDPAFAMDILARWQATLANAHTTLIHGAGHFPQEEQPDAVISALQSFLALNTQSPSARFT